MISRTEFSIIFPRAAIYFSVPAGPASIYPKEPRTDEDSEIDAFRWDMCILYTKFSRLLSEIAVYYDLGYPLRGDIMHLYYSYFEIGYE